MPDSDAKKRWDSENVIFFTTKLFKHTDADIIEFVNNKMAHGTPRGTLVKAALREMLKAEQKKSK